MSKTKAQFIEYVGGTFFIDKGVAAYHTDEPGLIKLVGENVLTDELLSMDDADKPATAYIAEEIYNEYLAGRFGQTDAMQKAFKLVGISVGEHQHA